jgi:hypothetical protein
MREAARAVGEEDSMTVRQWSGAALMARPRIAAQAFSLFKAQAFAGQMPAERSFGTSF